MHALCALPIFVFPGYSCLLTPHPSRRLPGASVLPSLSPRPVPRSRPVSGWGSTPREARDRDGGGAVSSGAVGIGGCSGRAAVGAGAQSSSAAVASRLHQWAAAPDVGANTEAVQAHCRLKPRRARWRRAPRRQQAVGLAAHGAKEAAAE